jgi:hypothetical protein
MKLKLRNYMHIIFNTHSIASVYLIVTNEINVWELSPSF